MSEETFRLCAENVCGCEQERRHVCGGHSSIRNEILSIFLIQQSEPHQIRPIPQPENKKWNENEKKSREKWKSYKKHLPLDFI